MIKVNPLYCIIHAYGDRMCTVRKWWFLKNRRAICSCFFVVILPLWSLKCVPMEAWYCTRFFLHSRHWSNLQKHCGTHTRRSLRCSCVVFRFARTWCRRRWPIKQRQHRRRRRSFDDPTCRICYDEYVQSLTSLPCCSALSFFDRTLSKGKTRFIKGFFSMYQSVLPPSILNSYAHFRYEGGAEQRVMPCFHRFHKDCIDTWLKVSTSGCICYEAHTRTYCMWSYVYGA